MCYSQYIKCLRSPVYQRNLNISECPKWEQWNRFVQNIGLLFGPLSYLLRTMSTVCSYLIL